MPSTQGCAQPSTALVSTQTVKSCAGYTQVREM